MTGGGVGAAQFATRVTSAGSKLGVNNGPSPLMVPKTPDPTGKETSPLKVTVARASAGARAAHTLTLTG